MILTLQWTSAVQRRLFVCTCERVKVRVMLFQLIVLVHVRKPTQPLVLSHRAENLIWMSRRFRWVSCETAGNSKEAWGTWNAPTGLCSSFTLTHEHLFKPCWAEPGSAIGVGDKYRSFEENSIQSNVWSSLWCCRSRISLKGPLSLIYCSHAGNFSFILWDFWCNLGGVLFYVVLRKKLKNDS